VFRVIVALLLTVCSIGIAVCQDKAADTMAVPQRVAFDPARDADKDIRDAVVEATMTGRRILLDVGGEWCIWCKRLDAFFASHPRASDLMHTGYVVVKVNFSKENKNEGVLSRYPKIAGYPHLFILDAGGKLVHSQDTGLLEEGKGYSEEKILKFLEQWAPHREANE
jgi:thiol:disulfide interchange protein